MTVHMYLVRVAHIESKAIDMFLVRACDMMVAITMAMSMSREKEDEQRVVINVVEVHFINIIWNATDGTVRKLTEMEYQDINGLN